MDIGVNANGEGYLKFAFICGNDLLVFEAKNLNNPSRQRPVDIFIPEFDNMEMHILMFHNGIIQNIVNI
jgi:hypothetical protein